MVRVNGVSVSVYPMPVPQQTYTAQPCVPMDPEFRYRLVAKRQTIVGPVRMQPVNQTNVVKNPYRHSVSMALALKSPVNEKIMECAHGESVHVDRTDVVQETFEMTGATACQCVRVTKNVAIERSAMPRIFAVHYRDAMYPVVPVRTSALVGVCRKMTTSVNQPSAVIGPWPSPVPMATDQRLSVLSAQRGAVDGSSETAKR